MKCTAALMKASQVPEHAEGLQHKVVQVSLPCSHAYVSCPAGLHSGTPCACIVATSMNTRWEGGTGGGQARRVAPAASGSTSPSQTVITTLLGTGSFAGDGGGVESRELLES